MNKEQIQEKFPLTYKAVQALHDTLNLYHIVTPWYNNFIQFSAKKIPYTKEEREYLFEEYISYIKQPIWSLCEDLLGGRYEAEFETEDFGVVEVGGVKFTIQMQYHMFSELQIKPYIWETKEEKDLLYQCFSSLRNYEINGIYRESLTEYYKEEK